MPKVRQKLSVKYANYVREFGDVLKKCDNNLICMACRKQIRNWEKKKYYVEQHLQTQSHAEAMKRYNCVDTDDAYIVSSHKHLDKFNNYIKEYRNVLSTDGSDLYCNACNKQIRNAHKKKYFVEQHFKTQLHAENMKRFVCEQTSDCDQPIDHQLDSNDNEIKPQFSDTSIDGEMNDQLSEQSLQLICANNTDDYYQNDDNSNYSSTKDECLDITDKVSYKLNSYCKELGNVVKTDGKNLFCNACNKQIRNAHKKKYFIEQHLATQKHIMNAKRKSLFIPNPNSANENTKMKCEMYENRVKQLSAENRLLQTNCDSQKALMRLLEVIKDKVKLVISECKCDNNDDKKELVKLIDEYENKSKNSSPNRTVITVNNAKNSFNAINGQVSANTIDRIRKRSVMNAAKRLNNSKPLVKTRKVYTKKVREKEYACSWPGCDRTYRILSQLKPHVRTHTKEKKFACNYKDCNKAYDRRLNLLLHMNKHKRTKFNLEKKFKCCWPDCDKVFPFRSTMNKHINVYHKKIVIITCEWTGCNEGFPDKDQYDRHVSLVHIGRGLYECNWPECGKRFNTKANLHKHMNCIHLKQKNYKCDFDDCSESFTYKNRLILHQSEVHNVKKPLSCDWPGCEFSTVESKSLKHHKMRHTGERPYKCSWPQCEWSFRQSDHLKTHMLKHTGERPVKCEWTDCDLRFQSRRAMKIHFEKTHFIL